MKPLVQYISQDPVHLFVLVPPHLAISKLVQNLKGKSSYKLLAENKQLAKAFWERHLWARGCFLDTPGNITDEAIMEYIQNQDENQGKDEFTVVE